MATTNQDKKILLEKVVDAYSKNTVGVIAMLRRYNPTMPVNMTKKQLLDLLGSNLKNNDAFAKEFVQTYIYQKVKDNKTLMQRLGQSNFKNAGIFDGLGAVLGITNAVKDTFAVDTGELTALALQKEAAAQQKFMIYSIIGGLLVVGSVITAIVILKK